MNENISDTWLSNIESIESVIAEPLKFKAKLAIGEDAYTSLRVKNTVVKIWEALGVAGATATIAQTTVVASTIFPASGFLAAIGIVTATTPIGWVITASAVSCGAYLTITRFIHNATKDRVTVIPKFINTPIDILGLGLFDFIAPLALKIAYIDGNIAKAEKDFITDYFVNEWGYDQHFVENGLKYMRSKLSEFSIKKLARGFAEASIASPDCNYESMSQEIISFLKDIEQSDERNDEKEEMAIEMINEIFYKAEKISLKNTVYKNWKNISTSVGNIFKNGISKHKKA